jgi:apolipoprotein N-acyltransferase
MTNVYWAGGWAFWGYIALCLIMAAYWGVLGLAWAWLQRHLSRVPCWLSLPVLWAAMEFFQARLFSGFGWGSLAYTQGRDLALLQWAVVGGAPLVAAILILANGLVARALLERHKHFIYLPAALALLIGTHAVGWVLLGDPDYEAMPFNVGIVQPAFPLEMKWDPEYSVDMVANTTEKSQVLDENFDVDLFVWPESLVMDAIERREIAQLLSSLTRETGSSLYTGSQRTEAGQYFNSSYLFDENGDIVDHYDKLHLAPFGEYVPFGEHVPFIQRVVPAISDITPGTAQRVFAVGERRFGPLICFEVLFAPMAERLRRNGADFLVVITNLGWFGSSSAIPQELEIARVRAVETRLPLIHCANTGISGVFDPWGRFEGLDTRMDRSGVYRRYVVEPGETIGSRWMGTLPVALPAIRPIPHGPLLFPWLAVTAAFLFVATALLLRFLAPHDDSHGPNDP